MKNKKILLGVLVGIILVGVVGITYAIFSYSQIGNNEQLITGDIYMHYKESNELTISNALPSNTYDPTKYFEFTIDGKNTNTKYDIYYDINLLRGAVPDGKTESNRIQDKFIKFRLTEFINGVETEIFNNKSFSDLSSSKRVHVDTISKNTREKVTHRYRLYMWISNSVVIGNTENPDKDYDQATWNNLFASIKVSSTGDFNEKDMSTDASCFETFDYDVINATLNSNMTSDELQTCVNYLTSYWGPEEEGNTVDVGETYQTFCNGTGTHLGDTFQVALDNNWFGSEELTYFKEHNIISGDEAISISNYDETCGSDVVIPSSLPYTTIKNATLNTNMTSEELQSCVNYFTTGNLSWYEWDTEETPEKFCNGTGTWWGNTFQGELNSNNFSSEDLNYFMEHNIIAASINTSNVMVGGILGDFYGNGGAFSNKNLTSVVIPNTVTEIGRGSFRDNEISKLVLPNNNNLKEIGKYTFYNNKLTSITIPDSVTRIGEYAFYHNQLTSVNIGNGVIEIGDYAFSGNQLTSVTIPNSVTIIRQSAFSNNQLTSVNIGNGITRIEASAFYKDNSSNSNLTSIAIDKSCSQIKSMNYYPWLYFNSPYIGSYSAGTTIYGSNNEVCDSYQ